MPACQKDSLVLQQQLITRIVNVIRAKGKKSSYVRAPDPVRLNSSVIQGPIFQNQFLALLQKLFRGPVSCKLLFHPRSILARKFAKLGISSAALSESTITVTAVPGPSDNPTLRRKWGLSYYHIFLSVSTVPVPISWSGNQFKTCYCSI